MQRIFWLMLLTLAAMLSVRSAHAEGDFLAPGQAFQFFVTHERNNGATLSWRISDGYYLYRKQLRVESEPPGTLHAITYPAGVFKDDEFFGNSEIYRDHVELQVKADGAQTLHVEWQGCSDAGLCYPPEIRRVALQAAAGTDVLGDDESVAERLSADNFFWTLMVFFGLGLLTTFTPCVLPMIPILSSLIAGSGAGTKRSFVLSLAFVLPMALTYALLGAGAALAGVNLQALQNPWMLGAYAMIFVALALSMFGFYELHLPSSLRNRVDLLTRKQRGGTIIGAASMGAMSALLVGPCMTAPLAGALLYISDTGNVARGATTLLSMSLGMGLPLLLVGTLGARLLPRPGEWMNRVKVFFGFVLLAMAILFAGRVLPPALELGLWGAWLLAFSVSMIRLEPKIADASGRILARVLGILFGLWGALLIVGSAAGSNNALQPLAFTRTDASRTRMDNTNMFLARFSNVDTPQELSQKIAEAGRRGQWTLVDFYADWCISCKVIEREVFARPRVQQALEDMQLLRLDITANNAHDRAMLTTYQAFGAPTILLIGPDGKEFRPGRIIGELSADEFLARLRQARGDA